MYKILVIEDDQAISDLICLNLNLVGYESKLSLLREMALTIR